MRAFRDGPQTFGQNQRFPAINFWHIALQNTVGRIYPKAESRGSPICLKRALAPPCRSGGVKPRKALWGGVCLAGMNAQVLPQQGLASMPDHRFEPHRAKKSKQSALR
jgi:hypothetical protein